jgi:hypothetical protein
MSTPELEKELKLTALLTGEIEACMLRYGMHRSLLVPGTDILVLDYLEHLKVYTEAEVFIFGNAFRSVPDRFPPPEEDSLTVENAIGELTGSGSGSFTRMGGGGGSATGGGSTGLTKKAVPPYMTHALYFLDSLVKNIQDTAKGGKGESITFYRMNIGAQLISCPQTRLQALGMAYTSRTGALVTTYSMPLISKSYGDEISLMTTAAMAALKKTETQHMISQEEKKRYKKQHQWMNNSKML